MISAVVLAAGESRRMGRPKMLLPWGDSTVLEHVLSVLEASGPDEILVVLGGGAERVRELVEGHHRIRTAFNAAFARGEMLGSLQCGLAALSAETRAALVCLGDQPQVRAETVISVCESFRARGSNLVVPSYRQRRGHPWLVGRPLWAELLEMQSPQTPRGFLNAHAAEIHYVAVDTPSVIEDLDTPEDYRKHAPGAG